jgi:subtilase family protein
LQPGLSEFSGRTLPGYNFAYGNTNTSDDYGHGTAVAATLCANANNAHLIAGVDWQCRLLPVKVLDQNNNGLYSWWAQGIDFAVSQGAKVINLSAGGFSSDFTLTSAITNAVAHGVMFVTITHNDNGVIRFPGNLTECITVGATDATDTRAAFSNYGPQIDLVAPGQGIATISTNGALAYWTGTSLAAPLVAGVCSLLASVRPEITPEQARALLCAGADDGIGANGEDTTGFDPYYGWGRLNAFNSLVLSQTRIDQAHLLPNGNFVLSWNSPPNAAQKRPYQVEFRTSVTQPWLPLDPSNGFSYGTNRTSWTDDGSLTGTNFPAVTKFYRVRLRQE